MIDCDKTIAVQQVEKLALLLVLILVIIIILTSDVQYFPPYETSPAAKTQLYKTICQRESPTALYLKIRGDAEAKLISVTFGRKEDIVRLIISESPIFKEIGSATYLLLFKTEKGWKDAMLLTQKERGDFKKQTAISIEEHAFIQKCFLPKILV